MHDETAKIVYLETKKRDHSFQSKTAVHSILQQNSNNHVSIKGKFLCTIGRKKTHAGEFYFWPTKSKQVLKAGELSGDEKLKSRGQQYLTRGKFFNPVPVRFHLDFHKRRKQPWK